MQTASISSSHSHLPILVDFRSAEPDERRPWSKTRALTGAFGGWISVLEQSFFVILGVGYLALMVAVAQTWLATFR
jgi:hypothetical protein